MPGFRKTHTKREGRGYGYLPFASRYSDPRGGRPSALERNILRYRAAEVSLYLFYADDMREFMLTNIYPHAVREPGEDVWRSTRERNVERVVGELTADAQMAGSLSDEDADAVRTYFADAVRRENNKKLRVAFRHAIKIGIVSSEAEADELHELLDYRNDIAHRIHRVMSDICRTSYVGDMLEFTPPIYNVDALDRLRAYWKSRWDRIHSKGMIIRLYGEQPLFETAENVYEAELKRLEKLIRGQIQRENRRLVAINAELDLRGTELVGDLDPRFPLNHYPDRQMYGEDYAPATGHLTKRGAEICYRLFDLGKSPIAVAYLMGMTLPSAKNRKRGWIRAGGPKRQRMELERYDMRTGRQLAPASDEEAKANSGAAN